MTREEAICHIKDVICENNSIKPNMVIFEQEKEALYMAIKALEQEPCEDAVNREAIMYILTELGYGDEENGADAEYMNALQKVVEKIKALPPVTQEPKTGHWIMIDKELQRYICSECGEVIKLYKKSEISKLEKDETLSDYPFSHCGAKMVEP